MSTYIDEEGIRLMLGRVKAVFDAKSNVGHQHSEVNNIIQSLNSIIGVPMGGNPGQILMKGTNNPQDVFWSDPPCLLYGENAEYHDATGIYGVKIDMNNSNPETCITLTDDLLYGYPIDFGEKPCLFKDGVVQYYLNPDNFTLKLDGTPADITSGNDGDVMIEIPKMGFFIDIDGTNVVIKLTKHPNVNAIDPRFRYYAHTRDIEGDRDFMYYGAYQGSEPVPGKLRSLSGKTPLNTNTITQFRTKAQANRVPGAIGYDITPYYPVILTQIMYIMKFKNLNSQSVLGAGITSGSVVNTGGTETLGMYVRGNSSIYSHIKFAGIEDWFGNLFDRIDGIITDDGWSMYTAFTNFADNINPSYTKRINQLTNANNMEALYMKKPYGTTEAGFLTPNNESGSASTYFCDYQYYRKECVGAFFGGYYGGSGGGVGAGGFAHNVHSPASSSHASHGARLVYI